MTHTVHMHITSKAQKDHRRQGNLERCLCVVCGMCVLGVLLLKQDKTEARTISKNKCVCASCVCVIILCVNEDFIIFQPRQRSRSKSDIERQN